MFLDPGMEIMSTILGSQARKPGLEKEKYASRPAQGRKPGLERKKIYSQTREAQDSIRFPSPPVLSPLAFRYPT